MAWLFVLKVPSSCSAPVLAKWMPLVTAILPRSVKANGSAATVNVGEVSPPLKAMVRASTVSTSTMLVPATTDALNVALLLLTTCKVLSDAVAPIAP